ncbi:MAG: glycosyltransferase family 2 protein, partial [Candidatus Hodarchaeota archaeon]
LTIWDNNSTDETIDFLKSVKDSRINEIVFSKKNVGQIEATNQVWSTSKCDLLGKIDNDCILTPGWTKVFSTAHNDIEDLGVVACWHFFEDDFDYDRAKHKIRSFNGHYILRHPWTCGTGFLVKTKTYLRYGPILSNKTTAFWIKLANNGFINGFYYPLIYQEHMDDPKSKYSMLKDERSYQQMKELSYNLRYHNQHTLNDRWRFRRQVLDVLLDGPWDVKYYTGWRKFLRLCMINLKFNKK